MMKGILSKSQLNHVLEHLNHHLGASEDIFSHILYGEIREEEKPWICFPPARESLDLKKVIHIEEIPVLYPGKGNAKEFYSFRGKHLVFHHDLLKSAFHLLSGYQEVNDPSRDQYDRFPYHASIQHALGIIDKPVVNYYFKVILEAVEAFAKLNQLPFEYLPVLKNPVLMLSHDIDRIGGYSFFETGFRFKQLLGLAPSPFDLAGKIKDAFTSLLHLINPFSKKDPFWTFANMQEWESERNIRSTYFFLEKEENRHMNSTYHFHEKRFRKLFRELSSGGHEIGIHGTIKSASSQESMEHILKNLRDASGKEVAGIRQHFLKYTPGETALIQEKAGLSYDSTLGFAEHEGFRNSYCWPFRMFDFANDRSMELWEIPLTCMDVSQFTYRKLDLESSRESEENLVAEVCRVNGVFSLLWHNHFFDEREFPGIIKHYTGILDHCTRLDMRGITGREIIAIFSGVSHRNA